MRIRNLPKLVNLAREISQSVAGFKDRKAEIDAARRAERQCSGITNSGLSSVWGDPSMRCTKHGGKAQEGSKACRCKAYSFPHRKLSGRCNFPDDPVARHPTPQGQRRYYKRVRKRAVKSWLKDLGL